MANSTTQNSNTQDSQGRRVVAVGKRPAGQKASEKIAAELTRRNK